MKRDLFLLRSIAICKLIRDNSHLSSYLPKAFLPIFVFMTVFIGLSFAANAADTVRVNIPRVTVTMARSYNFTSAANSVYVPVEFNSTMSADKVADYIEESNAFLFDHYGEDVVEMSGVSDDFGTIYLDIKPNTGIKRVLLITSTGSSSVVERNDYYPMGMGTATGNSYPQLTTNLYKYNGKEVQTVGGLGFTDYGARMYDDFTGRWFVPDPLAEKYASMSPYMYCGGNPVMYIDWNGMEWKDDKDKEIAESLIQQANKRDYLLSKQEAKINARIKRIEDNVSLSSDKKDNQILKEQFKLENVKIQRSLLSTLNDGLNQLENSSTIYTFNTVAQGTTATLSSNIDGTIVINNYGTTGNRAHEVTHAIQYHCGKISFNPVGSNNVLMLNPYKLEIQAYRIEYSITNGIIPISDSKTPKNVFGITLQ